MEKKTNILWYLFLVLFISPYTSTSCKQKRGYDNRETYPKKDVTKDTIKDNFQNEKGKIKVVNCTDTIFYSNISINGVHLSTKKSSALNIDFDSITKSKNDFGTIDTLFHIGDTVLLFDENGFSSFTINTSGLVLDSLPFLEVGKTIDENLLNQICFLSKSSIGNNYYVSVYSKTSNSIVDISLIIIMDENLILQSIQLNNHDI